MFCLRLILPKENLLNIFQAGFRGQYKLMLLELFPPKQPYQIGKEF